MLVAFGGLADPMGMLSAYLLIAQLAVLPVFVFPAFQVAAIISLGLLVVAVIYQPPRKLRWIVVLGLTLWLVVPSVVFGPLIATFGRDI